MDGCVDRGRRLFASLGVARFGFELRGSVRGQLEPKHASRADSTFDSDLAAHELDEPLGYHQADARACRATHRLLSEAIEWLVELGELFRGQTLASIGDADASAFRGTRTARHDHRSQLFVVFDGVGEQVDEDLLEPSTVGADEHRGCEAREGHPDPTLLRFGLEHGLAFGHDLGQGYWLGRQQHLSSLDHRQI